MFTFLKRITDAAKEHPVVAFFLTVLPLISFSIAISSWATRLVYTKTIAEYQRKTAFQELEISKLYQRIQALRASGGGDNADADQLPKPLDDHHSEVVKPAGKKPEKVTAHLIKDKPEILFDADAKLLLRNTFRGIRNVTFDAIIDGKRNYIDLYFDEIEIVNSGSYEYKFNLLDVSDDNAKVSVTRTQVKT